MATTTKLTHVPTTTKGRQMLRKFSKTSGMTMSRANEAMAAYANQYPREVLQFWTDLCGGAAAPAADHAEGSAAQS